MVSAGVLYGDQLFFTHPHTIGAGEIRDNDMIDKQGADKLLAALKR